MLGRYQRAAFHRVCSKLAAVVALISHSVPAKTSPRPCCVLSRLEVGALEFGEPLLVALLQKQRVGKSCVRVLEGGHCLNSQLSEVRAALPRMWWGDVLGGRGVHSPGLWVQLLLKMEPAISLPRKDRCGTERKSLENILQIFAEGVAATAQGLKQSLLVPLLRKLCF